MLVWADRAATEYLTRIDRSSSFRIEAFDIRAAIELSRMTAQSLRSGDKRDGSDATWAKVKFDRQIVAIAKVHKVSTIYTDDANLRGFALAQGIKVVLLRELPVPREEPQLPFVWDTSTEFNEGDDED